MKKAFIFFRGKWRYNHGRCPMCNSTATKAYDCEVCFYQYNNEKRPPGDWWLRFKTALSIGLY